MSDFPYGTTTLEELDDAVHASNLPAQAKVHLLRLLTDHRRLDAGYRAGVQATRTLATVLVGMEQAHPEKRVILKLEPAALQRMSELLPGNTPVIHVRDLGQSGSNQGAEVSLQWTPRAQG